MADDSKPKGVAGIILGTAAITAALTTIITSSSNLSDFMKDKWFDWYPPPLEDTMVGIWKSEKDSGRTLSIASNLTFSDGFVAGGRKLQRATQFTQQNPYSFDYNGVAKCEVSVKFANRNTMIMDQIGGRDVNCLYGRFIRDH